MYELIATASPTATGPAGVRRRQPAERRDWYGFINGIVIGSMLGGAAIGAVSTLSDLIGLIRYLWDREAAEAADVARLQRELTEAEARLAEVRRVKEAAEEAKAGLAAESAA